MKKLASVQVKAVPSSASESDIFSAIVLAWQQVFGSKPTINQVANTWAQIGIETGRGKYILNNNVGNINWTPGNQHDFYLTHDDRSVNGNPANRERYEQKRRAYNSLLEGVVDYLTLLKNRPGVLKTLVDNGSPQDFSHALADAKYYDPYVRDDYLDKNGKKQNGYTSHLSSLHDEFLSKYQSGKIAYNPNGLNVGQEKAPVETPPSSGDKLSQIEMMLNALWKAVAKDQVSERYLTKLAYQKNLLPNPMLIKIQSADQIASVEFARILCLALEEEMLAEADISAADDQVEVSCTIHGPRQLCLDATLQLCNAVSEVFEQATTKIGSRQIQAIICPNQTSSCQQLGIKEAIEYYDAFHSQFKETT